VKLGVGPDRRCVFLSTGGVNVATGEATHPTVYEAGKWQRRLPYGAGLARTCTEHTLDRMLAYLRSIKVGS